LTLCIDEPLVRMLEGTGTARRLESVYRPFFERSDLGRRIGRAVHLVGISVPMGPQLAPAIALARHLRALRPELRIVLGGPTFSLMAEDDLRVLLLGAPQIDAVVRYDGEIPLLRLAEQSRNGDWAPARVPGVSSRRGAAVVHVAPEAGPRLDALPFAEYAPDLVGALCDAELCIVQARGCYWGRCTYCDFVELYEGSPKYRTRTVSRIVDEMAHQAARHGVRRLGLLTESIPAAFARRMAEEIQERGLRIQWSSFAMVDRRFTREVFDALAASGCEYLVIGMETMTDRVLQRVAKAATQVENVRFLRDAHAAGLRLKINLIPDLPSTTFAESMASLEIFRELRDCIASAAVYPFEPTRSSGVGRAPESFGLIPVSAPDGSGQAQFASNHLGVTDPAMSSEERASAHRLYRELADEINSERAAARAPFLAPREALDQCFRLLPDRLAISEDADGIRCLNLVTRETR
jgi:radical SAM superfamily enzyme YgiQ (UPF0313 family)